MLQNSMFNKRLVVPLCDFRSKPLEELSPMREKSIFFSEQTTNMYDRSDEKKVERDKRHVKKKAVKTVGVKSAKILLVNEDKENNESDDNFDTGDVTLSAYEKMIERNRAERMAVLEDLKINEIKAEFCEAVNTVKKKLEPEKRKYTERVKISPPVVRKSRRLAEFNASLDLSEKALFSKALNKAREMMEIGKQVERDKRDVKKKAVKTVGVKSAKILLVNEDKENNESDDNFDTGNVTLSAYEKMIERNRAERMAILESLKINEIKAEFCEAVNAVKGQLQPEKKEYTKRVKISLPVVRKSRRLANCNASLDLSEEALFSNALNKAKLPPELSFKVALRFGKSYEKYSKDLDIQNSNGQLKFFSYDRSIVKCLILHDSNISKVTPDTITAATWHPDPDSLIFSAGDANGKLGILKVDSESNSYIFQTHRKRVTNLMFNPLNSSHLVSSSSDGTLRCGDMVKHVFNEVYNDETSCTYFDFLSQTTYIIAQSNGQVVVVDNRSGSRQSQKQHTCHEHLIKTVHVHPVNKCVFVTAENRGPIRLWDLRKLQEKPVVDIQYHKKCVSSAYFSPITGNSILSTSLDNTLSIFDSTSLTKDIKLKKSIEHNNHHVYRATWLPNSEDSFVIGSTNAQCRIELYDKDMNIYHVITDRNLHVIRSWNIFHPGRPALAAATLYGNVVIFTPQ